MDAEVKLEPVDIKEEDLDDYEQSEPLEDMFCPTTGDARPRAFFDEMQGDNTSHDIYNDNGTSSGVIEEEVEIKEDEFDRTNVKQEEEQDDVMCPPSGSTNQFYQPPPFEHERMQPGRAKETVPRFNIDEMQTEIHRCLLCKTVSKTLTAPKTNPGRAAFLNKLIPLTVRDVVKLEELKKNSRTRDMYFCLAHFKKADDVDDDTIEAVNNDDEVKIQKEVFDPTLVKEELLDDEIKEEPVDEDQVQFDDLSQPSSSRSNVNWVGVVPARKTQMRGSLKNLYAEHMRLLRTESVKFNAQKDAVSRILDRIEQHPWPVNTPGYSARFYDAHRTIPKDASSLPRATRKRTLANSDDSSMKTARNSANLLDDSFVDDLFKTMHNSRPSPITSHPNRVMQSASRIIRVHAEASRAINLEDSDTTARFPSPSSSFSGASLSSRGGPPKDSSKMPRKKPVSLATAPFEVDSFKAIENDALHECALCGRTPGLCFEVPCDASARGQLLLRMLPRTKNEIILLEAMKLEDSAAVVCACHLRGY